MKIICWILLIVGIITGCSDKQQSTNNLNDIATRYVKLGLHLGQYDEAFVDAYYGPDSLKPAALTVTVFRKDSLLSQVNNMIAEVDAYIKSVSDGDSSLQRASWMRQQLVAFGRRMRIVGGERSSFEKETEELFGVTVQVYDEQHFKNIVARLNGVVPGNGEISKRVEALSQKFITPSNKVDTIFRLATAEARKRMANRISMPSNENFQLEYVTGKSWGGYNWYKGNYQSLIQINTDLPIMIERAIDLACHEGYPGHHVYNMLLEKNLYRDKGWPEIALYPLFSPQSLIAEGSANYGIEMAFPKEEKYIYLRDVLLPTAGLDTSGLHAYMQVVELKSELNYVRNEVARGYINKTMTEAEGLRWLREYGLMSEAAARKSFDFIKTYGSYVICYNYGQQLIRNYVENENPGIDERWVRFKFLLSNPITPNLLTGKSR